MDAYPHIPEHRRLPLFTKLLQTVGEEKYLYACTCLCVEGLVTKNPIPDTTNEYEWKVRRPASHSIHLDSIQRQIHLDCLTTILLLKDKKGWFWIIGYIRYKVTNPTHFIRRVLRHMDIVC